MDLSSKSEVGTGENFKAIDTFVVLLVIGVIVAISIVLPAILMTNREKIDLFELVFLAFLAMIANAAAMYRLLAVWHGVEIDFARKTLSFPGGGMVANDLIDYVRPSFFLQYFNRITVDLSHIHQIGISTRTKLKWNKGSEKYDRSKIHILEISGSFGNAYVKFKQEQKCQQAYSSIATYNSMGEPVVLRK